MILKPTSPASPLDLDIVVPLWNEQEVVEILHRRLQETCRQLSLASRIIYVSDGCEDQTLPRLRAAIGAGDEVQIIELSRNFGQPAAILAGLRASSAKAVVVMDGDLQDPPELILEMIGPWQAGYQVVIAQRSSRSEHSRWRKWAFQGFHWLFQQVTELRMPANCGTFCLLDRRAADAICDLPELHRFFPGLRAWIGFRQTTVTYPRPARAAGDAKQTWRRLWRYAGDGILGYSRRPIQWLANLAAVTSVAGIAGLMGCLIATGLGQAPWLIAWGVLLSLVSLFSGLQLLAAALIGAWVVRVYEQSKQRPHYLVAEQTCFSERTLQPHRLEESVHRKAG